MDSTLVPSDPDIGEKKPVRRHRTMLLAVCLIIIVLVVGVVSAIVYDSMFMGSSIEVEPAFVLISHFFLDAFLKI